MLMGGSLGEYGYPNWTASMSSDTLVGPSVLVFRIDSATRGAANPLWQPVFRRVKAKRRARLGPLRSD